jgi:membrane protease YdiL (CAAX protease family)
MERLVPTSESALLNKALLYRVHDFGDVVALVLVVCVVGPLVEEMFFRGALYARLCHGMTARGAAVRAALVSSLLFVVSHEDARDWPSLVVVALVLGLLRAVSGSLLPCLALHVAFNSVGALALVSGVASVTRPMELSTFAVVASWVAAGGLVVVLARLASAPESARARSQDGP